MQKGKAVIKRRVGVHGQSGSHGCLSNTSVQVHARWAPEHTPDIPLCVLGCTFHMNENKSATFLKWTEADNTAVQIPTQTQSSDCVLVPGPVFTQVLFGLLNTSEDLLEESPVLGLVGVVH